MRFPIVHLHERGYGTENLNKQLPISWSSRATSIPGTESEEWGISFAHIFTVIREELDNSWILIAFDRKKLWISMLSINFVFNNSS